jgi:GNAT superfamily N-acetyltransferase
MEISLRPASALDALFIETVYFETQRWIIEALFGWRGDDIERDKFRESYDADNTEVILADGIAIGWWTVVRSPKEIHLDAIYLLASHQGRGIGSNLIRDLMAQAQNARIPIRLSTAKINPARELYTRLGFLQTHEDGYKAYFELGSKQTGGSTADST